MNVNVSDSSRAQVSYAFHLNGESFPIQGVEGLHGFTVFCHVYAMGDPREFPKCQPQLCRQPPLVGLR